MQAVPELFERWEKENLGGVEMANIAMLGYGTYASVAPAMVREESQLGGIHNEYKKEACMMPAASAIFGDIADMQNLREKESRWFLRVRSGNRIEVMKKLSAAFSCCIIMAGEFGAEGDEVAAFVKAKDEAQVDRCFADMKKGMLLKSFKKIMVMEE